MKTSSHGNGNGLNDLYLLPDNDKEKKHILFFLDRDKIKYSIAYSDVEGNEWHGKHFIEIPFGEAYKERILNWVNQFGFIPKNLYVTTYDSKEKREITFKVKYVDAKGTNCYNSDNKDFVHIDQYYRRNSAVHNLTAQVSEIDGYENRVFMQDAIDLYTQTFLKD